MATSLAAPSAVRFPPLAASGPSLLKQRWGSAARASVHEDAAERKAVNQLVVALLPLVRKVALRMRERLPAHVEIDDLISSGVLGLIDAVRRFDPSKQVKLEQYARHRIRGAILDGLRGLDEASRDMRRKNKSAERVYVQLESRLGRPPSDQEMASGMGMSLGHWYRTVLELTSLGVDWLRPLACVGTQDSIFRALDSIPADNEGHQVDACYRHEQKDLLQRALHRIPERERQVVELYYHRELTMREIGERLGIDESRVSQLHSSALGRLRRCVEGFISSPAQPTPRFAW